MRTPRLAAGQPPTGEVLEGSFGQAITSTDAIHAALALDPSRSCGNLTRSCLSSRSGAKRHGVRSASKPIQVSISIHLLTMEYRGEAGSSLLAPVSLGKATIWVGESSRCHGDGAPNMTAREGLNNSLRKVHRCDHQSAPITNEEGSVPLCVNRRSPAWSSSRRSGRPAASCSLSVSTRSCPVRGRIGAALRICEGALRGLAKNQEPGAADALAGDHNLLAAEPQLAWLWTPCPCSLPGAGPHGAPAGCANREERAAPRPTRPALPTYSDLP